MTTIEKIARRKLSLLELASELSNVSKACKVMGYSRQQFYEIRRNFQTYGADGLIDRLPGAKGPHPNRVSEEIEYAILNDPQDQWDARVTVNGDTIRAMTAYSYFGSAKKPPKGFVVALLGEDRSEFLVFKDGGEDWLEYGDYTYRKCN